MGENSMTVAIRSISVRLRDPEIDFDVRLCLSRAPTFLRFVYTEDLLGQRKWDALDQLEDEPNEGEKLIAGVLAHRGSMHVSYTEKGRRKGDWWATADYDVVTPQPDEATMRDRDRWREWCMQQPKDPA
jgi:hypothetical protein